MGVDWVGYQGRVEAMVNHVFVASFVIGTHKPL